MAERAKVHSVEALRELKPALVRFIDDCSSALIAAESDAGRTVQRLRSERLPYWKTQVRVRQEELTRAQSELSMKKTMREGTAARASVEDRKAVDKARRRLREAEEKFATTKQWIRRLERAVEKYQGGVQPLRRAVDTDMPVALAELERMSDALEAYVALGSAKRGSAKRGERNMRATGAPGGSEP